METLQSQRIPLLSLEIILDRIKAMPSPYRTRFVGFCKCNRALFRGFMSPAQQIRLSRAIHMYDAGMLELRKEGRQTILARKVSKMEVIKDGKELRGVLGFGPSGMTLQFERR